MATFPSTPAVGDEFTVGNNTFTYNGIGWVTIPTSSANLTYAPTPPAFASVFEGHIWVNSATMEQFVYIIDDTPSSVWVSLGSISALNNIVPVTNRNKIQNGCGLINQRYAGSPSFVIGNGWTWVVDRWRFETNIPNKLTMNAYNGTNITSNPQGYLTHFGGRTTTAHTFAAGDFMFLSHSIEGFNLVDLLWGTNDAKPITISFWMFTDRSGTYSVALRNDAASISYVKNVTHNGLGWEYKTFTVPGNTDPTRWNSNTRNRMLQICFDFGHGSNFRTSTTDAWITGNFLASNTSTQVLSSLGANYAITGVQLEVGSTPTEYEYRTWQQELEAGGRYFQKSYHYWDSIGTSIGRNAVTFNPWDSFATFTISFNSRMRDVANVTITPSNVSGFGSLGRFTNGVSAVLANIYNIGDNSFAFSGNGNAVQFNVNGFHWWAESEV